ncbi:membrane protein insertase, YidC/Oxa1 family, N-terminal domain protein [Belliella baltica DSM 15883]|uniref:Membrane protein insertase YidC n=1 Tax=Belliella baltica (strain DSM 15883 / CIP 108006 / LMG 21964 / BA134) TaxID=866536 RepID=I3Z8R7_BELBD|nr:membrane protein insertase YidC [Belliella baltica]AFL85635.1 membrane protein insertase, YidC/Oxa1 family, N-terminal domain protein [Belliella baltica DSM 15883]
MDKNQATGLILFAAVILVYSIFFASSPELPTQEPTGEVISSVQENSTQAIATEVEEVDSLQDLKAQIQYGVFAPLVKGNEAEVTLENDKMIVTFSTKGAEIKKVVLKEYNSWDQRPLVLMDDESSNLSYQLNTTKGPLSLNEFFFEASSSATEVDGISISKVEFTAQTASGKITRSYSLPEDSYVLANNLEISGLTSQLVDSNINVLWDAKLIKQEEDIEESRRKSNINFYTSAQDYDYLSLTSDEASEQVSEPLKWISFSQRFFTAGIIAENQFNSASLEQITPKDTLSVKNMKATIALPLTEGKADLSYYFGPNKYKTLKKITPGFENNVDMGYFFVSWVNKYIIVNLFVFLEKFFSNYGIIIIIIVLIIKAALFPLTYKSYVGMAKMRVIKPEIDELKEKYKDDPTKQQQEQMKLFGQLGVSPISGCLPMLLQMPFLFAMFFFFPNSIEMRQESFLWAHDLSTYDTFFKLPFTIPFYGSHVSLFTLLMTVSQIAYTHFNNQLTAAQGPMKNLGYIMPIGFMFILNSYPAALSFYYFVSNMVTFGQQALIKLFVDDKKIREKVEASKVKNANKKKSKFQQKLEDAMKAAEANKKKK